MHFEYEERQDLMYDGMHEQETLKKKYQLNVNAKKHESGQMAATSHQLGEIKSKKH